MNIDEIREDLYNLALKQYYKPYEGGAHGPEAFDCAGLIWYLYHELLDINIYDNGIGKDTTTSIMTSSYGKLCVYKEEIKKLKDSDFRLGDILLFHEQALDEDKPTIDNKYPGHCGMYIGNLEFIHSSLHFGHVIIGSLYNDNWNKKLIGKKDIFEDNKVLNKLK